MSGQAEDGNNGMQTLAETLALQIEGQSLAADLLLEQTFERLIATSPKRAAEAVIEHHAKFSRLGRRNDLVQFLGQSLIERKLFNEAAGLMRVALRSGWRTGGTLPSRLAKVFLQDGQGHTAKEMFQMALAEDPRNTAVLKGLYECASRQADHEEARSWLALLAETDPSYSTLSFVFNERRNMPTTVQDIRIALISSYVLDWFVPYLDDECRKAGVSPQHYMAPFNQYMQEALDPASGLYRFQPEIVFLALSIEDLFPSLTEGPQEEELKQAHIRIVEHVSAVVEGIESRCGAMIVVHEFLHSSGSGYGILDNRVTAGVAPWIAGLNLALAQELQKHNRAYLLPVESIVGWVGKERSHNPKLSYMAGMRLAEPALAELAKYSVRYVKALKGLTRKCVVLDLDGTLWGGIVGEVGSDGIALGPAAPGIAYLEFQRALLGLVRRGVLLAVCSKNNPEDALPVIRHHPHMILKEEHFAAMRINWRNKAENIREIAKELNIGLDSLVFIDDNPNERELVKQLLPEVLTIDLPRDASLYRKTIERLTDFERLALTKEDEMRAAQYQAQARRQASKSLAASVEDYLRSLDIEITVGPASQEALARLVQLFNKTNQFNLTTKRYRTEEVARFLASPESRVYDLCVKDRFGDHGLVGTAVVLKGPVSWRIDSFLMSCRVMGLGVETAFLEQIYRDALREGGGRIVGVFSPTSKNHPVREFYSQHGFRLDLEQDGRQEWVLEVAHSTIRRPDWIAVTGERMKDER